MRKHVRFWTYGAALLLLVLATMACSPEKRDWKKAQKSDAEYSLISYLEKYPLGAHAAEAKVRIEEFAFRRALSQGTVDALKEFLKNHPNGANSGKAADNIDDLTWKSASVIKSVLDCEGYLAAFPQGRYAEAARTRIREVIEARQPEWRDVRTIKFVLRQTFREDVKDVTIGFEKQIAKYFPFIGIKKAGPDTSADAVITVDALAEAHGARYSRQGTGEGTFYYTGAHVSGRIVLEIPGRIKLREDFYGASPVSYSVYSDKGASGGAAEAPFEDAMARDFPKKAVQLLVRAFGLLPMISALGSPDADTAHGAALVLQKGRTPALELLLRAAENPSATIRANVALALRGHANAGSIAALINLLGQDGEAEKDVRTMACESLSWLGGLAVPALAEACKDSKAVTREGAAVALGRIWTDSSLALLSALFGDPEKSVREAAIRSVGERKSRAGVAVLIEGLGKAQQSDRLIWLDAIEESLMEPMVFEKDQDTAPPVISALDWDRDLISRFVAMMPAFADSEILRQRTAVMFERIGGKATEAVVPLLKAETPALRLWAADVLERIGGLADVRFLVPLAGDTDPGIRLQAAELLRKFTGQPAAAEALARLLRDPAPDVAKEALLALSPEEMDYSLKAVLRRTLASPDTIKLLISKLEPATGGSDEARRAASAILAALGRMAVAPLAEALKGGSPAFRLAVVETMGQIGDPQSGSGLAGLAKDPVAQADDRLMPAIYDALAGTKSPQAFAILSAGLKDAALDRQFAAIRALGTLGDLRAADILVALLPSENEDLRIAVNSTMRELTNYSPDSEDTNFDWKAWWAKNRARYGLR